MGCSWWWQSFKQGKLIHYTWTLWGSSRVLCLKCALHMALVFSCCDFGQVNTFESHFHLFWSEDNKIPNLLWGSHNLMVYVEVYFATCHSHFNSNIIINVDGLQGECKGSLTGAGRKRESQDPRPWHLSCPPHLSPKSLHWHSAIPVQVPLGAVSLYLHSASGYYRHWNHLVWLSM